MNALGRFLIVIISLAVVLTVGYGLGVKSSEIISDHTQALQEALQ